MSLIGQNLRMIVHDRVDRPLARFARDHAGGEARQSILIRSNGIV